VTAPEPGLHPNIPFADYLAWDACSASRLSYIRERSAAYCRWRIDHVVEPTPAMAEGSAAHFAILQPDLFEAAYVTAPDMDRRTKAGKEMWAEFSAGLGDRTAIKQDVRDRCLRMRDSVWSHPAASALLKVALVRELSAVWTSSDHGIVCKARLDALHPECIVDLKRTRSAQPGRAFAGFIARYGVHRQAAHYLAAVAACGEPRKEFRVVAVEPTPPHETVVHLLDADVLRAGKAQVYDLMRVYAECISSGRWPGYADEEVQASLPEWELRETFPDEYVPLDYSDLEVEQ